MLMDAVQRALEGKTIEAALVEVHKDQSVTTDWALDPDAPAHHAILSGATMLVHRLAADAVSAHDP
jgi:hypothetical protein